MTHCLLYGKLIRDLIALGFGGFTAYLIVKFRWWIIMSIGAAGWFVIGWLWGVPKIKKCDCARHNKGWCDSCEKYHCEDPTVTPFDLDIRRWRWQKNYSLPEWVKWVVFGPIITCGLVLGGWLIWAMAVVLYHRYWIC